MSRTTDPHTHSRITETTIVHTQQYCTVTDKRSERVWGRMFGAHAHAQVRGTKISSTNDWIESSLKWRHRECAPKRNQLYCTVLYNIASFRFAPNVFRYRATVLSSTVPAVQYFTSTNSRCMIEIALYFPHAQSYLLYCSKLYFCLCCVVTLILYLWSHSRPRYAFCRAFSPVSIPYRASIILRGGGGNNSNDNTSHQRIRLQVVYQYLTHCILSTFRFPLWGVEHSLTLTSPCTAMCPAFRHEIAVERDIGCGIICLLDGVAPLPGSIIGVELRNLQFMTLLLFPVPIPGQ